MLLNLYILIIIISVKTVSPGSWFLPESLSPAENEKDPYQVDVFERSVSNNGESNGFGGNSENFGKASHSVPSSSSHEYVSKVHTNNGNDVKEYNKENKENNIKENNYKENNYKDNNYKEDNYKGNNYKDNNYKENSYKDNNYKDNNYKENNYKENIYKENKYKENNIKEDNVKENNFKEDTIKDDKIRENSNEKINSAYSNVKAIDARNKYDKSKEIGNPVNSEAQFFEKIVEFQPTSVSASTVTEKVSTVDLAEIKSILSRLLLQINNLEKKRSCGDIDSSTSYGKGPIKDKESPASMAYTTPGSAKALGGGKEHHKFMDIFKGKSKGAGNSKQKWGEWTDWSACSVSCGRGREIRWRHCREACDGIETEMEEKACQLPACGPGKLFGFL